MTPAPLNQAMRAFAVVGAIGFIVDAGVFQLIHSYTDWLVISRLLATSIAILVTWVLHRRYVFNTQDNSGALMELGRYVVVQSGGILTNLVIYFGALWAIPSLREIPVVAVAIGAGFALIINFIGSRNWAFVPYVQESPEVKHD